MYEWPSSSWSRHARDVLVAEQGEVPDHRARCRGVVAHQCGQTARQRRIRQREARHLRIVLHQLDARVADLQIEQQQRVDVAGGDPVLEDRDLVVVIHRHAHEQRVVAFLERGAEAGDEAHDVGFRGKQLWIVAEHEADSARARLRERLCRAVRTPAEFARHLQHLLARGIGNTRLAIERIRDRTARHT